MWYVLAGGADPAAPTLHPDAGGLPGAATLQRLADGIGGWALIAAMMGIVVGAVLWAFGHYSQNYQQAYNGRRGVMVRPLLVLRRRAVLVCRLGRSRELFGKIAEELHHPGCSCCSNCAMGHAELLCYRGAHTEFADR